MDDDMLGFLWAPMNSLIVFSRVDEREAEMIEEVESARMHAFAGSGSLPWDLVCDFDEMYVTDFDEVIDPDKDAE